ncbi:MAG: GNAT family N-acetyltransferase [Acidobacteriota bacterium]|nr:GNAT family N-acetyltransferase [Acidobacteriota bacterium]
MRDRRDGTLPAPVALAGGRTLTVRPVSAGDVEALLSLYRSLPETDLYRRFFQAHLPPRTSIERMAGAALRGDIGLVAEVHEPDGTVRLVGEAACAVLPDGDGELALTVAPSARGWLGPYLLALLCDEAAARGLPNIEADVLQDNHPMLALAQARGYATMDHSECPSTVRVVFNSVGRVPTWPPGHDRRRVLVEVPGARWHAEAEARAAGLRVLVCPGPTSRWCRCPAVAGRPCPLAAAADAVVDAVDPDTSEAGRALLRAHHEFHARTPMLLEGPPAAAGVLDRLLELLPPPPR